MEEDWHSECNCAKGKDLGVLLFEKECVCPSVALCVQECECVRVWASVCLCVQVCVRTVPWGVQKCECVHAYVYVLSFTRTQTQFFSIPS